MSHFYGIVDGQSKTSATRRGSKSSGLTTIAASWNGCVQVHLFERDGKDCYRVVEAPWHGQGRSRVIAEGIIGEDGEA